MSEYWKSQPKKFCEFCKCWITDNKPSVDFHERGKRHQENVKLKIEEAKKKGFESEKKKLKENEYMERMEKAAMKAFKKDLAENPELAKQYNVKLPEVFEGPQLPEGFKPPEEKPPDTSQGEPSGVQTRSEEGEWMEAMSEMGYPYYWNTATGKPVWVAPEKYVSLVDQGLAPPPQTYDNKKAQEEKQKPPVPVEIPLPPTIENIPLPGEGPPAPPPEEEEESEEEEEANQDRGSRGVYGIWARVQKEQDKPQVDLQLPTSAETIETIVIPMPKEEVKLKFKEKIVTSLGTSKGPVAFKKRKIGDSGRNVRRRNDDDD
ncbi:WW domain-binding protein 4-like [Mya arenaria]|uniref:WW domain-binding protein 4-like n=1 Tax=Mya arenaria TaxID=6604 RepID=UPI0022E3B4E0|nr:WW domain-binding protein 4-like [Mya arenaria]